MKLAVQREIGQPGTAEQKRAVLERHLERRQHLAHADQVGFVLALHPIAESRAVLAVANEAKHREAVGALAREVLGFVGHRGAKQRLLDLGCRYTA